jgi:CheY-like chemotaxis protein
VTRDTSKNDLLAAMIREIPTPMNAILGMAEVLSESDLDAVQRQYVEAFRRAGGDLRALINDLLDFRTTEAAAVSRVPETALNILIAEDSSDSRLLIEAYLETSPHRLTFVEDGNAAVERFAAGEFDLVLMDMQMPVMDGLEATRTIRAYEKEHRSHPATILALTANAGRRDIERCRAAGCTAHLSKPISSQELLDAIAEHGQRREAAAFLDPTLDPIEIEIPEGLEELVPGYLEARKAEYAELLTLLAASDFDRVRVLAHNMKGSGTSYGFPNLTELGRRLEQSAKQSDHEAVQSDFDRLGDYLRRVRLPGIRHR